MLSEQPVILIPVVNARAVVAQQQQVVIAQLVVCQMFKQLFQREQALYRPRSGPRNQLVMLRDADCIHDVIAVFSVCIRCDFFQLILCDAAATAPLHLRIENIGAHILHKQNNFQRLDIRSGRNKRDRYSNTKILFRPHISDQRIGIARRIGDLLHEMFRHFAAVKHLAEYIPDCFNDLGRVVVVFRKDQRFRDIRPVLFALRIQIRINRIPKRSQHLPDLLPVDDRPIQIHCAVIGLLGYGIGL